MESPPAVPLSAEGPVVARRYRIVETLGAGGMGVVYRAEDLDLGRTVALKTFRVHSPDELFRLKHEFRSIVDLPHRNLVRLYDLVVTPEVSFFTMEYVRGVDFVSYVRGVGRGTAADSRNERCRNALRQLTAALLAVHGSGTLHRDIKPSNVLVDSHERLVLLDFGLARDLVPTEASISSGAGFAGTLAYMPPEILAGTGLTEAADWYSVGAMTYEALTGAVPFPGPPIESLMERGRRRPAGPRTVARDVAEDLDTLVLELLEPAAPHRAGPQRILACVGDTAPTRAETVPDRRAGEFELVGRMAERSVLRAALTASRRGAAAVMVEGPSGIGKTALVQHAVAEFESEQGALVLRSVCHPREHIAFKAVDRILDGLGRFLARQEAAQIAALLPRHPAPLVHVFPVLGRVRGLAEASAARALPADPQELRRVAFAALRELLGRIADTRPLVLWIDDLHWADLDSLLLLREVLRPPDPPPLLLICSFRRDDLHDSPLHDALVGQLLPALTTVYECPLVPLSPAESKRLSTAILGTAAEEVVEAVAREGGGVPFLLTELSCDLRAGSTGVTNRRASLDGLLASRLDALTAPARDLLETIAVAGHPLAESVAVAAAGVGGQAAEHVESLHALRMVRAVPVMNGIGLTTYHDRVRQMVLARTSTSRRTACHARLADALEAAPVRDLEALVDHYAESGRAPSAAACAYAAADRAAQGLAFNRAASLYRRAIELHGTDHPSWLLYERLGNTLINAGRGADGARHLLAAAAELEREGGDRLAVLRLKRRAAEHLLRAYCRDEGLAVMRDVVQAFGLPFPATPARALASMLGNRVRWRLLRRFGRARHSAAALPAWDQERLETCWSAGLGFAIFDILRAADCQARHALLAWRAGDARQLARAISGEAQILSWEGGTAKRRRAAALHREATRIALGFDDPQIDVHRSLMSCITAFAESRHRDVVATAEEGIRLCRERCHGVAWELASLQVTYLSSLILQGEVRRVWELFPAMLREADERGDRFAFVMLRLGIVNAAWLAIDQPDVARTELAAAVGDAMANPWMTYQGHYAGAQIALYEGRPAEAWDGLATASRVLRRSQLLRMQIIRKYFHEVYGRTALAMAVDLPPSARRAALLRVVARYVRRLSREDAPEIAARTDALRAGLCAARGDLEAARHALECTVVGFDELREGVAAAAARRALGALAGGADGAAMREAAERWMVEHGITHPARMAAMVLPGFRAG
jgi:serine/threonine protein kinase